jgi:hypothetical protein
MGLLRVLNRAAFICNICFLIATGMLYFNHPVNPGIASLIIIMGFILSIVLNVLVNLILLYRRLMKKSIDEIPKLLRVLNGVFLIIQLILLFK